MSISPFSYIKKLIKQHDHWTSASCAGTIKGHSKCAVLSYFSSFERACNWYFWLLKCPPELLRELNVNFSTIMPLQYSLNIWQYVQLASQLQTARNPTSSGAPHSASSSAWLSETSHPYSWWNCGFVQPNHFCTNCQKLSQGNSSSCLSSSPGTTSGQMLATGSLKSALHGLIPV